jgi:hypothetical protein
MKEASELLFYLTAYPWFFMCTLLILSLSVLRTKRGFRCQFVFENYLARRLSQDLIILEKINKPEYEPPAFKGVAWEDFDFDFIRIAALPSVHMRYCNSSSCKDQASPGSGVCYPLELALPQGSALLLSTRS